MPCGLLRSAVRFALLLARVVTLEMPRLDLQLAVAYGHGMAWHAGVRGEAGGGIPLWNVPKVGNFASNSARVSQVASSRAYLKLCLCTAGGAVRSSPWLAALRSRLDRARCGTGPIAPPSLALRTLALPMLQKGGEAKRCGCPTMGIGRPYLGSFWKGGWCVVERSYHRQRRGRSPVFVFCFFLAGVVSAWPVRPFPPPTFIPRLVSLSLLTPTPIPARVLSDAWDILAALSTDTAGSACGWGS